MCVVSRRRAYFTYFDSRYLLRGLALIASLREVGDRSPVIVVALDEDVERFFKAVPVTGTTLMTLPELECADPDLLTIRSGRSRVEYYFTLTSAIANFIMMSVPESSDQWLCYLDADLLFFSSPDGVFVEHVDANILITPHGFSPNLMHLSEYGKFNVGFMAWRTNPVGRQCVSDYRNRCIEWCFDRVEDGKFADQKYLDTWPLDYAGVVELSGVPINVSYWNIGSFALTSEVDVLLLNEKKLIAWHFSGFTTRDHWNYSLSHCAGEIRSRPEVVSTVYAPYVGKLRALSKVAAEAIGFPRESSLGRLR
jgi:hypothetical protein